MMIDRRTFLFQGAAIAAGGCMCPFIIAETLPALFNAFVIALLKEL